MIEPVLVVWVGVLLGLLVTPRGRATLARCLTDMRHVLGFDRRGGGPRDATRRWHDLAAAEDAADPALRRCAAVKAAYLAGEFGPEELDWRILLAFKPPPGRDPKMLNWAMAQKAAQCSFRELHSSGSGYFGTFCDCGHDMNRHYNGGCNDCDAFRSQFPRPEMQEIGKPPEEPLPTEADPRLVNHLHW